jgi:hypothetical protein
MAARARRYFKRVFVYDPLTWYWAAPHPVLREVDMYLAQDFLSVR